MGRTTPQSLEIALKLGRKGTVRDWMGRSVPGLGPGGRKPVGVRVPSPAPLVAVKWHLVRFISELVCCWDQQKSTGANRPEPMP